ncbi:MAG: lipopolysaccharide biosynthesis protein [Nitrospiraceae bacterium]
MVQLIPDGQPQKASLDRVLVHGIAWAGGMRWLAQGIAWLSSLIIVRLLQPEDYGLVAMAGTYLALVQLTFEFGLGATVLTRSLDKVQLAQINSFCVLLGLGGFLLSLMVSVPIASFFDAPELRWVVVVMSVSLLLSAFRTVPYALLERELRFKFLAVLETAQALIQAFCMILFAFFGFGYWTLVFGGLIGGALSTVVVVMKHPCAFAWPSRQSLSGGALTFGWQVLASRLSWYVQTQSHFLIGGHLFGTAALGAYSVAWSLASLPVEKVTAFVGRVSFPFFASIQNDSASLRRYYLGLTESLGLATFGPAVGLAVVAEEFAATVLGEKWLGAVLPLQLLALSATFRSIDPMLAQLLFVRSEAGYYMRIMIVAAVALVGSFAFLSQWGIAGLAAVWIVVYPLTTLPVYRRVFQSIELSWKEFLKALQPALNASLIMAVVTMGLKLILPVDWPMTLRLATEVLTGGTAYLGTLLLFYGDRLAAFRSYAGSFRSQPMSMLPVDTKHPT